MPDMQRTTDDEIDLIKLLEVLWNSKLFMRTITIFATIVGFAHAQVSKPIAFSKPEIWH